MFVDIGNYKNETVKKLVTGYFWHEFMGTEEELVNQIHEAISEKFDFSNEKCIDSDWSLIRDYNKADYKTFNEFHDGALMELYCDVRNCFKEVGLSENEKVFFGSYLYDYISQNLCERIIKHLEHNYPDTQIKTGDVSFDDENNINEYIGKIIDILENVAIKNITKKGE